VNLTAVTAVPANSKPVKVLIVDDNEAMRRTIKSVIQDLVDEIVECDDGDAALRHCRTFRPDWIVMDIRMKEMDGLTATRAIKSSFAGARVVIVTSYDEPSLREEAASAGACAYVLKDDLSQLTALLSNYRS
jgi:two-component system response regulator DegU